MKLLLKSSIAIIIVCVIFSSCKKDKNATPKNNLPTVVNTIISAANIDSLKKYGAIINEGTTPPTISGTFLLHPNVCSFDNSGGNFAGKTFDDYTYKFSSQNTAKYTIRVDYQDVGGGDEASDSTSTFISGSGNLFTIFAESNGVETGVSYVNLQIISGEITSTGIKNLQTSDYIKSKGSDPNGQLEPAGSTRIFYDSDLFSELQIPTIVLNSTNSKNGHLPNSGKSLSLHSIKAIKQ